MAFKYLTLKIYNFGCFEIPLLKVVVNNVYRKLYESCSNSVGPLFDVKIQPK